MRLGEVLKKNGLIRLDQIRIVLTEQKINPEKFGNLCVKFGFISEVELKTTLASIHVQANINLADTQPTTEALNLVSREYALCNKLLPLHCDTHKKEISFAVSDSPELLVYDELRCLLGKNTKISLVHVGRKELLAAIDKYYEADISVDEIINQLDRINDLDVSKNNVRHEIEHPIVVLVSVILNDAVRLNASDVHIEPEDGYVRIRYRVDGVLRIICYLHAQYHSFITVRIKVLSNLDISETRAPQDGGFSMETMGRKIDFRVSVIRVSHGENIVVRVLDRQKRILNLTELGADEQSTHAIAELLSEPTGLLLVCGPTGSGKTTTLYSMLGSISNEEVNITTLEDPVEYPLSLLRQVNVNSHAKLDFANGVRCLMRQDPDIMLIGEIRDQATAEMAIRASMTGHKVFATLHSKDAASAVTRLCDLGVSREILTENLIGVVAQRLMRKLCEFCKKADRLHSGVFANVDVYKAAACNACGHSGYRGRFAVMEVLDCSARSYAQPNTQHVLNNNVEKQYKTLLENGKDYVIRGWTSIDELKKVARFDNGV